MGGDGLLSSKQGAVEIDVQCLDGKRPDSDDDSPFEDSDEEAGQPTQHLQPEEQKDNDARSAKGSAHSKRSKFS